MAATLFSETLYSASHCGFQLFPQLSKPQERKRSTHTLRWEHALQDGAHDYYSYHPTDCLALAEDCGSDGSLCSQTATQPLHVKAIKPQHRSKP